MRKAAVRHGDPTTTGGFVLAYDSTIYDKGRKRVALDGEEATCGNCKGTFKILGTGKGMSEKGRVVVLDDDHVLCPCGRNRVIVGSNPGVWVHTSDGGLSDIRSAGGASTASTSSRAATVYDEQVRAAAAGATLEGYPYFIETADGRTLNGRIDASGKLPRIDTDTDSDDYHVYWGDEALAKQQGTE
ncbi:PAAR domain-containing protein [Paraburkholderia sp. BL10I2N1]|uniref:PAAR domain-containing protein n=1 Tax=Paraburkholderia sp. BL10I2N1 TaxID=1938796 RepID=UPI00105EFF95|nr:PAAR domain-containing protein [Paraburkholderia sp. BL10I2N1]TDN61200.1 hypothetical protein B0G77_4639 [Paraburkholderia sp. BL10I2N1]